MHMADALVSPAVGISLWAAGAAVTAYSAGQSGKELSEQKIPLMGVMGAFVFAVQMINFANIGGVSYWAPDRVEPAKVVERLFVAPPRAIDAKEKK